LKSLINKVLSKLNFDNSSNPQKPIPAIEKESMKLLAYLKTEIPASAGMTVKDGG